VSAVDAQQPAGRRASERSEATRAALIEVAGALFSERGYAQTSMRDIAREGPVSMGAIYMHFKNKADLLVGALEAKITEELENPDDFEPGVAVDHVERLTGLARVIDSRRDLRALLVQAAAACQTDDETRTRVRDAQEARVTRWIEGYEANRTRLALDEELDIPTAVLYTWAVELGLGVLEAFGMEPPSVHAWADLQNRVARSLRLAHEDA
jgi:AcrR family transcriptional regulator